MAEPRPFVKRKHVGTPGSVSWMLHQLKRKPYGVRASDLPKLPPDEPAKPLPWREVISVLADELGLKTLIGGLIVIFLRWLAMQIGVDAP